MKILVIVSVVFVVLSLMKLYIYKRFMCYSMVFNKRRKLGIALLVALGIGEISLFIIRDSAFTLTPYIMAGSCIVFAYCLFMAVLCVDICKILARFLRYIFSSQLSNIGDSYQPSKTHQLSTQSSYSLSRRVFLKMLFDLSVAALFVVFSIRSFTNALLPPPIKEVSIKVPNLRNKKTIAMITDVHIGKALGGAFLSKVVAKINALQPDIVVIVGDLVDNKIGEVKADLNPLKDLQSKEGVYYVAGNHEYYHGIDDILAYLHTLNLTILHNTNIELEDLNLAGVSDLAGLRFNYLKPDLASAKKDMNPHKPSILLAHQPKFVRSNDVSDFDVVLCGHTHAGQVFPLSFFVWLDQHYVYGLYELPQRKVSPSDVLPPKKTQLYVSSGVGFWGPAIRFLAPSEIVCLRLE
ncbi:metallophosphoesterase [Helicobacter sp. MIT 21-1697]|uniref:metallophosphoesterase n=1 Tax=Helicobacter sp. MIT 21-1697 TaxID=2993733 RepID=UPI00224B2EFA|nr:metallophosphoesterase [Helicobacter sp. MIT 21-1697]MCX2717150.1 metallophosphoesterase [Helicobacter sp. MIT 21-1697]